MATWVDALEPGAPDVVAAWRGIDEGEFISVRREVRKRAGPGSADGIVAQLGTLATALAAFVETAPEEILRAPGGEEDWNVAQAIGHACEARAGLCLAAGLAAAGRFPPDAPTVVPGIPGPPDADRATLLRKIAQSQRLIERSARTVAGHETEPCPLVHPLVGTVALRGVAALRRRPRHDASRAAPRPRRSYPTGRSARMSPFRPDLVDCWMFRVGMTARGVERPEILLIRRSPGRILPGLWQCVSGSLEPGERITAGALRELAEETGFGPDEIEAFYDLDLVNQFHEPSVDGIVTAAVFAVRVRTDAEPRLSSEHDDANWHEVDEAHQQVIWPGYRAAIERIRDDLSDPERAGWFELTLDGERAGTYLGQPKLTRW